MIEIHVELASVTAKPPLRALADVELRWTEGELQSVGVPSSKN